MDRCCLIILKKEFLSGGRSGNIYEIKQKNLGRYYMFYNDVVYANNTKR